ncbi:MAG: TIM barrel protein [Verrucomicrobiota bacterium]
MDKSTINRRDFAKSAIAAAGAAIIPTAATAAHHAKHGKKPFKLLYAPGFRHFKMHAGAKLEGQTLIDHLRFMHSKGFRAIEDNGMMKRPVADQVAVGKELKALGMTMGVFVTGFGMYTYRLTGNRMNDDRKGKADLQAVRDSLQAECEKAVETAKRVNAKWTTVVLGAYDHNVGEEYQFVNVVENLKFCSKIFEPHGITMVLEPLNFINHPDVYLKTVPQAYAICKAVNSRSCKILNDLYHQQIQIGNLIPNIDAAWDETAYIQVGDNPGRKEPTTGEINYKNVFRHLYQKGYKGIIGMEHGISRKGIEGEVRLIEAYREVDDFEV